MYTEAWAQSYAVNSGYYDGSDKYTVGFSYSFANKTDSGKPRYACNIASAKSAIVSATLQSYCSSLLSVTGSTQVVTVTPTVSAVTFTTLAAKKKRATTTTPAALQKFPASAISSACAMVATSGAVVSTTTTASATTVYTSTSTSIVAAPTA
jgi:hypothetical protein